MQQYSHDLLDLYLYYNHLSSTMSKAQELLEKPDIKGIFLVLAAKQRLGEGRNGNVWYSPAGGLWFTLALCGFRFSSNFTLFLGVQIHKAIRSCFPELEDHALSLKWPNDLYLNDKKLAGIIVKHVPQKQYYLCGIGINTDITEFPQELRDIAISLHDYNKVENVQILTVILDNIKDNLPEYLIENQFSREYYFKHDYLVHKQITISTEFSQFEGIYQGVNKDGALLLKLETGAIQPFYAGTVNISKT